MLINAPRYDSLSFYVCSRAFPRQLYTFSLVVFVFISQIQKPCSRVAAKLLTSCLTRHGFRYLFVYFTYEKANCYPLHHICKWEGRCARLTGKLLSLFFARFYADIYTGEFFVLQFSSDKLDAVQQVQSIGSVSFHREWINLR